MKRIFVALALVGGLGMAAALAGEETAKIPNSLADAKVGEWVVYKLPEGFTQKHMVVERTGNGPDATITIRITDMLDGKVTNTREIEEVAGEAMAPMPPPKDEGATAAIREGDAEVRGKEVDAIIVDVKKGGALLRSWYLVPEIPVYGLFKRVDANGTVEFEAIDYDGGN